MLGYLERVKRFHKTFGLNISEKPKRFLSQNVYANRMRLILEELSEYSEAVARRDLPDIADALADLLYVVFGACVEHGLPMDKIFREVDESNMTKTGGHFDDAGKFIKPDSYKPVNLEWLNEKPKTP